jgi:hypothetical protein
MRTKQQNKNDLAKPMDPGKVVDDYEAQGHLQDLIRAEMIKMDPDKMKKVHALAGRHSKAIKSVQDLKDTYQSKFGPKKAAKMAGDDDGDE